VKKPDRTISRGSVFFFTGSVFFLTVRCWVGAFSPQAVSDTASAIATRVTRTDRPMAGHYPVARSRGQSEPFSRFGA
jgi:hypothetical protein